MGKEEASDIAIDKAKAILFLQALRTMAQVSLNENQPGVTNVAIEVDGQKLKRFELESLFGSRQAFFELIHQYGNDIVNLLRIEQGLKPQKPTDTRFINDMPDDDNPLE